MRVGVIGLGRVGSSVMDLFAPVADVVAWDISLRNPYPDDELATCDFAVVAVGTPGGEAGSVNVSQVHEAVKRVPVDRVLLKSTVSPGTTDALVEATGKRICHWPEFVSESRYHNPYFPSELVDVPFVILGGLPKIRHYFIDRLVTVLGPTKTYFQCTALESEIIKLASNSFFATKVTYATELRRLCEAVGADWHAVREGWVLDPRVGSMHTAAFAEDPGFGGKCLPKDLDALIAAARDAGYSPELLEQVRESNHRFQTGD